MLQIVGCGGHTHLPKPKLCGQCFIGRPRGGGVLGAGAASPGILHEDGRGGWGHRGHEICHFRSTCLHHHPPSTLYSTAYCCESNRFSKIPNRILPTALSQACIRKGGVGREGGLWNPKICVPKMAQIIFSLNKFQFIFLCCKIWPHESFNLKQSLVY